MIIQKKNEYKIIIKNYNARKWIQRKYELK